jgi:hypothetical protein
MRRSGSDHSSTIVAMAPQTFGDGGGDFRGGFETGLSVTRPTAPIPSKGSFKECAFSCVIFVLALAFLRTSARSVVWTCSNCGSRASRGQWQNRDGCPTCGSDLHS